MPLEHLSRREALRLLGVAVAGTTVGCAPSDPVGGAQGVGAQASAGPSAAPALKEFVVANESEPADLLPYASGFAAWLVDRQVYETLAECRITIGQDGAVDVKWVPRLAVSWERPDPLRWRFRLREGVTFHNGEPFNARAVKSSYDVLSDRDAAAKLKKSAILARYAGCEVVNDHTVDILTRTSDAEGLTYLRLGMVTVPPKLLAERGLEAFRERPVGTGRYRFGSWQRGQEIVLERNADYWGEKAPWERLRYMARPDVSVRAQTVRSGEAHFAYNVGAEQGQSGNAIIGGGFQSSGIRLNNTHPLLADVRVRRALNHAVDRSGIVKSIFRGTAVPLAFFGFQPVKLEPFAHRPDEARRLIADAGATGSTLELVYGETRIPEEDQLAEVYKAAFESLGLKITLRKVEPVLYNQLSAKPFKEQPAMLMETTSSGNYGEIAAGLADKYGCKGSGTFCNEGLDKEFNDLSALEGEPRRGKLQAIAERLHTTEVPRVWVAGVRQVHLAAPNLRSTLPANAYLMLDDIRAG